MPTLDGSQIGGMTFGRGPRRRVPSTIPCRDEHEARSTAASDVHDMIAHKHGDAGIAHWAHHSTAGLASTGVSP